MEASKRVTMFLQTQMSWSPCVLGQKLTGSMKVRSRVPSRRLAGRLARQKAILSNYAQSRFVVGCIASKIWALRTSRFQKLERSILGREKFSQRKSSTKFLGSGTDWR